MVPRAPVPHLTHDRIVHARRARTRLGRGLEHVAALLIAPVMIFVAALAVLASRLHIVAVRPGVNFEATAERKRGEPATDTGTAFLVVLTEKGPIGTAVEVNDLSDFQRIFGGRVAFGYGYDAIDVFSREGGSRAFISRIVGPDAAVAQHTFVDRAGSPENTIRIEAKTVGEWGNDLKAAVENGVVANTFRLVVSLDDVVVETSADLASPTEAVAWGELVSDYVNVIDIASDSPAPTNNPAVVAATALTTGTDDRASAGTDEQIAALDVFPAELGPGQVAAPGFTSDEVREALVAHAQANNRVAILDDVDTDDTTVLAASVATLRALADPDASYGGLFAPWVTCPGLTKNTTRTIPPSILSCALAARSDRDTGNANAAAAGGAGIARYCTGVTQAWTNAERQGLNEDGVNVIIFDRPEGRPVLYGWRSLVDPEDAPEWLQFSSSRFRMQIGAEVVQDGRAFAFAQIDGKRRKISEFAGVITGRLLGHYNAGALFGQTPDEAYAVDVGPPTNTVETIADGQLNVQISAHISPFAEMVNIVLVKIPITETI